MADTKKPAAAIKALREALAFYADPKRYQGSNHKAFAGDKYTPTGSPYMQDVRRDNGDLARAALASTAELEV